MTRKRLSCTEETAYSSMQSAAKEEVKATKSAYILISGDGMWKTRGQTSRLGICTSTEDKTGKIIDAEIRSSYCKSCYTWKEQAKNSTKI